MNDKGNAQRRKGRVVEDRLDCVRLGAAERYTGPAITNVLTAAEGK